MPQDAHERGNQPLEGAATVAEVALDDRSELPEGAVIFGDRKYGS